MDIVNTSDLANKTIELNMSEAVEFYIQENMRRRR